MKNMIMAMAFAAAFTVVADVKIGTVNMVELVKLHPSYETNKALLKSTDKDYKSKLDKQQDALKAIADEGKKAQEDLTNPMLSSSAKASAQKKLDEVQRKYLSAQQELRAAAQHYQNELADLETRLMRLQTEEIRAKISKFAEEKGFDLVLDRTMLGYAKESFDVTDDVLKSLGVDPAKRATLKAKDKEEVKK